MHQDQKIIITGAAGLVGQNLVLLLREQGYLNIIALDKNANNLALLKQLNPEITTINADLSEPGSWANAFKNADCVILLHAQITGLYYDDFVKNNLKATENILAVIKQFQLPFTIHVSSSVVNSVANDYYTRSKTDQEKMVLDSNIACCVLRPTLMFGWFDPKHLGWLARFMERVPVFPIPGDGKYARQPLYSRDFCRIIIAAMEKRPLNKIYDIVGAGQVDYIDIIKEIKKTKKLSTWIVNIPYYLFYYLLKIYALFDKKPPFTADQLKALTAGDFFTGVDTEAVFNVKQSLFSEAINETFNHPSYSQIRIGENT